MAAQLTERRKADRKIMAAGVAALCAEYGVECEVRDFATFKYSDGSPADPRPSIWCIMKAAGGALHCTVEFEGGPFNTQPNYFCLPWYVPGKERLSRRFGVVAGAEVNPHHRGKCTAFADGFDDLLIALGDVFALVADGEAFEAPPEALAA